ncbi:hypothetical protein BT93_H2121 [Corymbia citriodora subsp. variegata]|nr:hypothetical protein BT93_H2121 [Corymbia citriodora subsp. variegata]
MTKLTYLNELEVLYILVTDSGDDDPVNPRPGTLQHAVIQDKPLWIIFERDMVIRLKNELVMNSFKTIDGRGANVHIGDGPCITVHYATNIIIHGIHIHDCKQSGNAMIRDSPRHYGGGRCQTAMVCQSSTVSTYGSTTARCRTAMTDSSTPTTGRPP